MAPPTPSYRLTPHFFIKALYNEDHEDQWVHLREPPFSHINPVLLSTKEELRASRSLVIPVNTSPASSHTVSVRSLSSDDTVLPDSWPTPDRQDVALTPCDGGNYPNLWQDLQQQESNNSMTDNRSYGIAFSKHSSEFVKEVVQAMDGPFAEFNNVFDHETIEPPQSVQNRLPTKRCGFFGKTPTIHSGITPLSRTSAASSTTQNQSFVGEPSSSVNTTVPLIGQARHDRKSYYTVRIRADGSQSLIRLPPNADHEQKNYTDITNPVTDMLPKEVDDKDEHHDLTWNRVEYMLTSFIQKMMFVSGEQAEPSAETTWMIEEIVREQVVEMLKEATGLANRRGSKSISIVDLIFQIRHNPSKVSRLKTFLSWKDVRKNVKDSDDKAGGADDALDLEDATLPGANPTAPQKSSTNKKAKLVLPWEVQSYYNETVPEREDEEDEEEEEQNEATLARLASADERTKNMTRKEYVVWSDCRQASFTFRKGKRFREWAGFGTIIDSKPNDDVIDILGFLTFEIVQTLTEEALRVKAAEDLASKKASGLRGDNEANKKRKREGCTLFEMPEEGRTPVEPKHVREAFRRLQIVPNKYKFMRQGYAGVRTPLRMI